MRSRLSFLITTLAALLNTAVLQAEETNNIKWYSVEYIVFENNPLGEHVLEPWTKEPVQIPDNAIDLGLIDSNIASNSKAFTPLNNHQRQLQGTANKLKRLSSYTPLSHGGWIQPLVEKNLLQPIRILQTSESSLLEGTITFHRGRFLHLDIDLQLSERAPLPVDTSFIASAAIQPTTIYRLKETRRIKTQEIHYFDHPRFAVLAIVEKIDSPEEPISTTNLIDEKQEINAVETITPSSAIQVIKN
ncbi:MAG: hypothetical protein COB22_07565 [Cycloclasticus sp.]|nr:MAG: hypothetical protein COB22_07565 [Cycloclasticus sp.]